MGTRAAAASPCAYGVQGRRYGHHRDEFPGGGLRERTEGGFREGALGTEIRVARGRHTVTLMGRPGSCIPDSRTRQVARALAAGCRTPGQSPPQGMADARLRTPAAAGPRTPLPARPPGTANSPLASCRMNADRASPRSSLRCTGTNPLSGSACQQTKSSPASGVPSAPIPSWKEKGRRSIAAPPFWSRRRDPGVRVGGDDRLAVGVHPVEIQIGSSPCPPSGALRPTCVAR